MKRSETKKNEKTNNIFPASCILFENETRNNMQDEQTTKRDSEKKSPKRKKTTEKNESAYLPDGLVFEHRLDVELYALRLAEAEVGVGVAACT